MLFRSHSQKKNTVSDEKIHHGNDARAFLTLCLERTWGLWCGRRCTELLVEGKLDAEQRVKVGHGLVRVGAVRDGGGG